MSRNSSVAAKSDSALSAAATISFLKETRGLLTWTIGDLRKSLLISAAQAAEAVAALQFQGYIKPSEENPREWITTLNGESVSDSKTRRFDRTKVEDAVAALKKRIASANADRAGVYRVVRAVAFGDFLSAKMHDSSRVQAADVGVELAPRKTRSEKKVQTETKVPPETRAQFLRKLRARDLKLNLLPYHPWMSSRSHRNIL